MDDIVIIAPSKEIAREWLAKIKEFLRVRLHLDTNKKTKVFYMRQGVNAYGVYVVEVVKGGPAEKAGLQAGDRIVSVDGTEIASKDDLGTLMQKHAAGDTLSITIAREGQMQTVNVTLGEKTASNS